MITKIRVTTFAFCLLSSASTFAGVLPYAFCTNKDGSLRAESTFSQEYGGLHTKYNIEGVIVDEALVNTVDTDEVLISQREEIDRTIMHYKVRRHILTKNGNSWMIFKGTATNYISETLNCRSVFGK